MSVTADRSEPTSTDIRRTALEMFAREGYDGTSIRDIAASVGIRGASMYHHFASKEEILWDLTLSALGTLADAWEQEKRPAALDPESQLRAFVRAGVRFHAEHRTAARLVNSQLHRLAPEHYAQAVKLRDEYQHDLAAIVEECVASGRHDAPDVHVTVFAILQMTSAIADWFDPAGPLAVVTLGSIYEELALKMLAPSPSSGAWGES